MVRIVDALNQLRPEYMWLPLDIAADLEVLCRNKLFEEFDAVDFYCFLNLRPSMGNYVPLEDNKRRTCYLIRRLSRYIQIVVYWQTEIAKKCGLTYGDVSRYGKECGYGKAVGRKQSQSNEEFVRQLDEILGNYDPTNKVWD